MDLGALTTIGKDLPDECERVTSPSDVSLRALYAQMFLRNTQFGPDESALAKIDIVR